tara:strand:- start:118 stop:459 length:342 start_codon:yes stop_codon:yes gene_type:complete
MIYPKCKNTSQTRMNNVMACRQDGTIIPCCFFGSNRAFKDLANLLGDDIKNINLKSGKTIDEINRSEEFQRIEATWNTDNPLPACVAACSSKEHIENEGLSNTGTETTIRELI